jgi:hypothetical protein
MMLTVPFLGRYEDEGTEAPPVVDDRRPPSDWPSAGVITASDLYVRYREELDPVLKGISFSTGPAEKVCTHTAAKGNALVVSHLRVVAPAQFRRVSFVRLPLCLSSVVSVIALTV